MTEASQATSPGRVRKHWLERRRAVFGMLVLTPFVVAAVTSPLPRGPEAWRVTLTIMGWILFLSGATLRLWSTLYIGGRKGDSIVDHGPYSIVRNPLYLGSVFITVSLAFFLQSATLAAGMIPASIAYLFITLRSEERRLASNHGAAYLDYCRRVPRLIPNWRKWKSAAEIEVDVRCLAIEGWRSLRWLTTPVLAIFLMQLRTEPWWPHWFDLP